MNRPSETTVTVPGGSATFRRLSPTTAEVRVENETPANCAILGRRPAEDVETLFESEIFFHALALRGLRQSLLRVLGHEGTGAKIAHTDHGDLRRGWKLRGGGRLLHLDGMDVRSTVRVSLDDPEASDAAVASAILSNVMQARERHLEVLHQNLFADVRERLASD
jgi:hypothetical protein